MSQSSEVWSSDDDLQGDNSDQSELFQMETSEEDEVYAPPDIDSSSQSDDEAITIPNNLEAQERGNELEQSSESEQMVMGPAPRERSDSVDRLSLNAIPLIEFKDGGKFSINKNAQEILKNIRGKTATICFIGSRGSGKSCILNLLINHNNAGFQLNAPGKPYQTGVYMWSVPKLAYDTNLLFFEFQGFSSTDQIMNQKFYALAHLLASQLVYIAKGPVDERTIQDLSMVQHLSDHLRIIYSDSEENNSDSALQRISPQLIILLRDFNQTLLIPNKRNNTYRSYFENIIKTNNYYADADGTFQAMKESITKFYRDNFRFNVQKDLDLKRKRSRDQKSSVGTLDSNGLVAGTSIPTFTFPRSLIDEDSCGLGHYIMEDFGPEFEENFEIFREFIMDNKYPKIMNDEFLTGGHILGLLKSFCFAHNNGEIAIINTSWQSNIEKGYEQIYGKIKLKFNHHIRDLRSSMPYEEGNLITSLIQSKESSLKKLTKMYIRDSDIEARIIDDFEDIFMTEMRHLLDENYRSSADRNQDNIMQSFRKLNSRIEKNRYQDEFQELETDWLASLKKFEQHAIGPAKFSTIANYLRKEQAKLFSHFFWELNSKYEAEIMELQEHLQFYNERLKLESTQVKTITSDRHFHQQVIDVADLVGLPEMTDESIEDCLIRLEQKVMRDLTNIKAVKEKVDENRRLLDEHNAKRIDEDSQQAQIKLKYNRIQ